MKLKKVFLFIVCICFVSCNQAKIKNNVSQNFLDEEFLFAITEDCEQQKTYLKDAAIDISLAVDNGLNLDDFVENIKNNYLINVKKNLEHNNSLPDEKGIFREAFLYAITDQIKTLPTKNKRIWHRPPYSNLAFGIHVLMTGASQKPLN